jgi:hypothetical protein
MGPIEEQVEAELACCQRVCTPISPTRSQAELLTTTVLTVDIEHWQQKNTVVVCGDFARIGRQGAESPTNSVVPQFGEITRDAQELR